MQPLSAASLRAVERRGVARRGLSDLYHTLMTLPLAALLASLSASFLAINLVFTSLYLAVGGLAGVRANTPLGDFFFSVQTLSTTGFGATYPVSAAANFIASAEMLFGLMGAALATGILFARLSRPQARVMFSNVMVIKRYHGVPTLMFRIVNERRNQITEAKITLTLLHDDVDEDGSIMRRMIPLKLERDISPLFALSWVVMHKIVPESPLLALVKPGTAPAVDVIICSFTGIDDTLSANIYARHVYGPEDILTGRRFVDIIERRPNGDVAIDYGRFHETEPEFTG